MNIIPNGGEYRLQMSSNLYTRVLRSCSIDLQHTDQRAAPSQPNLPTSPLPPTDDIATFSSLDIDISQNTDSLSFNPFSVTPTAHTLGNTEEYVQSLLDPETEINSDVGTLDHGEDKYSEDDENLTVYDNYSLVPVTQHLSQEDLNITPTDNTNTDDHPTQPLAQNCNRSSPTLSIFVQDPNTNISPASSIYKQFPHRISIKHTY